MAFVDASGSVGCGTAYTAHMRPFGFILRMPPGETMAGPYLRKLQWDRIKNWTANAVPPVLCCSRWQRRDPPAGLYRHEPVEVRSAKSEQAGPSGRDPPGWAVAGPTVVGRPRHLASGQDHAWRTGCSNRNPTAFRSMICATAPRAKGRGGTASAISRRVTYLRDQIQVGDGMILYYHSNANPPSDRWAGGGRRGWTPRPDRVRPVVGQTRPEEPDRRSDVVSRSTIRAVRPVAPATRSDRTACGWPALAGMELLRKGSRLSVQPVASQRNGKLIIGLDFGPK